MFKLTVLGPVITSGFDWLGSALYVIAASRHIISRSATVLERDAWATCRWPLL